MSLDDCLIAIIAAIIGVILAGCSLSCSPVVDVEAVKAVAGLPAQYTPAIKCSRSF